MGNQNTSGIVEDEKATNEAPQKTQEVSSSQDREEEKQIVIVKDEGKACQDSEADIVKSAEKVTEEHKGSADEDSETQTTTLPNVSINQVEPKELNLEEEILNSNNEIQDQAYTLPGDMQKSEVNSNSSPQEAVEINSKPQEDQNTLAIVETLEVDTKDDHNEEKDRGIIVAVDIASVKDELLEKCNTDNIENSIGNERVDEDPPHEEMSNSFNTLNESTIINEKQNECLAFQNEEKLTTNELGKVDETSFVDQSQPSDQEAINQILSCSDTSPEMIKSDIEGNGEKIEVEIDSLPRLENLDLLDEVKTKDERALKSNPSELLVQTEGLNMTRENQEDDTSTGEAILEKSVTTEKENESETNNMEKRATQVLPTLSNEQYSENETPMLDNSEYKEHRNTKMLDIESTPKSYQIELKKSPSFDFGLPFDARSEESDQTPLLYHDRSTIRSFSTSSTLRFQNRSVQTEYLGKAFHNYEAVEVEEKTIRMERSNSESSKVSSLNMANVTVNPIVATNGKQENGLKGSPLRENFDVKSPKGSEKRKGKSSLFTTCICCSAAIS